MINNCHIFDKIALMKTTVLFIIALFSAISQISHAQRHIIYENNFTNYSVSEGWIMHNLDGDISSTRVGLPILTAARLSITVLG